MAMRNRFEILASLPAADDFEDPVGAIKTESSEPKQVTHVEPQPQLQEEQLPPRNPWEVPDCVDKPIPCVLNVVAKPEPVRVATKAAKKPARPKPELPVESDEHDEEEQTTVEAPKQHTPIVWSYHPPQPHKFRQTPASHPNQSKPKFDRKANALPKHMSSRGNSKANTHQI